MMEEYNTTPEQSTPVEFVDTEALDFADATATAEEMGIDTDDEVMMSALLDAMTEGVA
jgi:hypothetical protein